MNGFDHSVYSALQHDNDSGRYLFVFNGDGGETYKSYPHHILTCRKYDFRERQIR